MILILSDGGSLASDIERQLDLYGERYINFYTDFRAAGSRGRGSVIVGAPTASAIMSVIRANRISSVIDCMAQANAEVQAVCARLKVFYVKYLNMKQQPGLKLCLYYAHIADMIKRGNNALFYASARTVRAVADTVGRENIDKMYTAVIKSAAFDTSAALEYSIPLLNVIESEMTDSIEEIAAMIKKTNADILVCDDTVAIEAKAEAAFGLGIPIILTHSMGIEFIKAAPTARDAVIAIHTKTGNK